MAFRTYEVVEGVQFGKNFVDKEKRTDQACNQVSWMKARTVSDDFRVVLDNEDVQRCSEGCLMIHTCLIVCIC